jgi:Cenp-O kinetochore centromere component
MDTAKSERLRRIHGKAANNPDFFRPLPALRLSTADKTDSRRNCPSPTTLRDIRQRQSKVQRLYALQRRRIDLAAQVAAAECRLAHTYQPTLEHRLKAAAAATLQSPGQSLQSSSTADMTSDAIVASKLDHHADPSQNVAQWHAFRRFMCLDSAFRLAGISIYPHEDTLLALRFDIHLGPLCPSSTTARSSTCSTGTNGDTKGNAVVPTTMAQTFGYLCFFTVVVDQPNQSGGGHDKDDDDDTETTLGMHRRYLLRLFQHTVPPAIPLKAIFEQHFAGRHEICVAVQESSSSPSETVQAWPEAWEKLRRAAVQIYQACYSWHVRKETFEYLQYLATTADLDVSRAGKSNAAYTHEPDTTFDAAMDDTDTRYNDASYRIANVQGASIGSKASYKTIQFQMQGLESSIAPAANVSLQYSADLCRPLAHQPVSATIQLIQHHAHEKKVPRGRFLPGVSDIVSDTEEEMAHRDVIGSAQVMFLRLPIAEALQQVANAMREQEP